MGGSHSCGGKGEGGVNRAYVGGGSSPLGDNLSDPSSLHKLIDYPSIYTMFPSTAAGLYVDRELPDYIHISMYHLLCLYIKVKTAMIFTTAVVKIIAVCPGKVMAYVLYYP